MLKILTLVTAALVALTIPLIAQDGGPVLRVDGGRDQIVHIRAKTRHTTVIVLPATENVLDFVVGDSEYWHLTGAAISRSSSPLPRASLPTWRWFANPGASTHSSLPSKTRASRILSSASTKRPRQTRESRRRNMNRPL